MKITLQASEIVQIVANHLMDDERLPEGDQLLANWVVKMHEGGGSGEISLELEVRDQG